MTRMKKTDTWSYKEECNYDHNKKRLILVTKKACGAELLHRPEFRFYY